MPVTKSGGVERQRAIRRLHDSYFDVVLSDLKMGGSDGMDVLRTTRAMHPTTP
jgi:CheY-like chemotaxis protein